MAGRGSQRGGSKRGPSEDGHGAAASAPSSGARFRASERTPRRSWWNSELDASVKEEDKFVVCSYNVLSPHLLRASQYLYAKRNQSSLPWDVRGPKIVDLLTRCQADVMMLQEVEADAFKDLFVARLEPAGYSGHHEPRKGKSDGCAVFWKKSKFTAEKIRRVELSSDGGPVLTWGNVGVVVVLRETAASARRICVGNTHLVFNEKRGEIKLAQASILAHAVAEVIAEVGGTVRTVPAVIGGDFNSTPTSKILEFMIEGRLRYDMLDRRLMSGQLEVGGKGTSPGKGYVVGRTFAPMDELPPSVRAAVETVPVAAERQRGKKKGGREPEVWNEHYVSHPLRLLSPFDDRGVTSYQDRFADMVDYILYSEDQLTPTAVLPLISYQQLVAEGGMPSPHEPSDHQLVAVRLAFRKEPSAL
eukprot:m.455163 g.455163  ORF g.455163 m.455163 type:complete len:417 (-) comp20817_c0_seq1:656-1906(-)